jgi:hypothetical protein
MRCFAWPPTLVVCFIAVAACSSGGAPTDPITGSGGIARRDAGAGGTAVGGASGSDAPVGTGGAADAGAAGMDGPVGAGGRVGGAMGTDGPVATGGVGLGGATGRDGPAGTGGSSSRGSGGSASGGASGGKLDAGGVGNGGTGSGGRSGTGGSTTTGSGGRTSGVGGSTGAAGSTGGGTGGDAGGATKPKILWTDSIQSGSAPWGLDGYGTEYPVGTTVTPSDANGANFSVVPDPLGGAGRAIRHFAIFDTGGARSQGGLYGDVNTIFGNQAKRPEGIWVAQEWYFPEAISAGGDAYCWINLWDWHSIDADRGNRWHTSPGLMLARDGSMKVVWEWGGPAASINKNSSYSSIAMPVGRWFDVEMHYVWTDSPNATITLWIDGKPALELSGVQTRASSHQVAETYLKFYGSTQGRGPWTPTPSLKYTRNVRVAGERIWRQRRSSRPRPSRRAATSRCRCPGRKPRNRDARTDRSIA